MPHKSWKAKHAHRQPKPDPAILQRARDVLDSLLLDLKIERATPAQIYEDLKRKYRGDVPPGEIWNHLADRRIAAITTTSGAGLIARG